MFDPDALIGRAISNLCIIETLGSGGMGLEGREQPARLFCRG
jgi:hypothetical protein